MKLWFKEERRLNPPEVHTPLKQQRIRTKHRNRIKRELPAFHEALVQGCYIVRITMSYDVFSLNPRTSKTYEKSGIILIPKKDCAKVTDRQARKHTPGAISAKTFEWDIFTWHEVNIWLDVAGVRL